MSIEPLFLLCVVYMECTLQAFTAVPAPTQVSAVSVLAALCVSMLMLVKSFLYTHTLVTFPVLSKGDIDKMAASKHTCSAEAMKFGISVGLSSC